MKFASFDLETAKITNDPQDSDLGISVAAVLLSDRIAPSFYFDEAPRMSKGKARNLLCDLLLWQAEGYIPITWNGTSFDYRVLAEESGMPVECASLALNSIDMMLYVFFSKGHFLSLDKALAGAKLKSKTHEVTLRSGEVIREMSGTRAPELWQAKEYAAVIDYLTGDVVQPLKLMERILETRKIGWYANSGKYNEVPVPEPLTVGKLFEIPEPDTSWMTNPVPRRRIFEWMPKRVLNQLFREEGALE